MRRRKKNKQQVKIVICSVICLLFIMTAGYAAFGTQLTLAAKGNIKEINAAWQLKKNIVTSGDGLYTDSYEEGRYVYRGEAPNNYINFNEELWRVISVENDGSLKIILANELPSKMAFASNERLNSNNTYCRVFSDGKYYGCNAWNKVEGNLTVGSVSGTVSEDASLNVYLNNQYYNALSEKSKQQIQPHIFNTGAIADTGTVYSSNGNTIKDIIVREKTLNWYGRIALINVTDYMKASLDNCSSQYAAMINAEGYSICRNKNYLYKPDYWWWTLGIDTREARFVEGIMIGGGFGVASAGYAEGYARPAVYLKQDITLSGEGTLSNPYKIN